MAPEPPRRPVIRDIRVRCKSKHTEAPGRTHECRDSLVHDDVHLCICGTSWPQKHG